MLDVSMRLEMKVDLKKLESRFSTERHRKRQEEFAQRAATVMEKYVPKDEGTLRDSEPLNSDYAAGLLVWNTPYAARQYYDASLDHTEPGTTDHWDRTMMRKEGSAMEEYAKALYREA